MSLLVQHSFPSRCPTPGPLDQGDELGARGTQLLKQAPQSLLWEGPFLLKHLVHIFYGIFLQIGTATESLVLRSKC